jgi:hypothetical protein
MGLGLRAAAKELGISHVGLMKAERNGRVHKLPDGSFDVEACRKALEANSHPQKQKSARAQQRKLPPPVTAAADVEPAPDLEDDSELDEGDGKGLSYNEVLRRRELVRLFKDRLDLAVRKGELVRLGEINAWFAGALIRFRDILLAMPGELGDRVAQEIDPKKCRELMETEVKRALRELSEYLPSSSSPTG